MIQAEERAKYYMKDLIIEITRQCNLQCPFCIRGDAQNKDMGHDIMSAIIQQISRIAWLNITGGEPSLAWRQLSQFIDLCKRNKTEINNFHLSVNGVEASFGFIETILKLKEYCIFDANLDNDQGGVWISNSDWHKNGRAEYGDATGELKSYPFVKEFDVSTPHHPFWYEEKDVKHFRSPGVVVRAGNRLEGRIYINVVGDIMVGFGGDYESQKQITLGNIITDNLGDIFPE